MPCATMAAPKSPPPAASFSANVQFWMVPSPENTRPPPSELVATLPWKVVLTTRMVLPCGPWSMRTPAPSPSLVLPTMAELKSSGSMSCIQMAPPPSPAWLPSKVQRLKVLSPRWELGVRLTVPSSLAVLPRNVTPQNSTRSTEFPSMPMAPELPPAPPCSAWLNSGQPLAPPKF
ncbi:MAG: hypothetical protein IPH72_10635 [Sandaracinaceae bacterium]|nr:hypothetical protein [Sandaracinaceae bacterium]